MNNENQFHLVLGGLGAIGSAVIKELLSKNLKVKAIEKSKIVKDVETINTDILNL
jgi:nucleoside-diphosphate-sugar epimerase